MHGPNIQTVTPSHIRHLLKIGKVIEKSSNSTKSDIWKSFSLLYYASSGASESNEYTQFVKCQNCSAFLKHHKSNSGTTHLRNHLASCSKSADDSCAAAKLKQTKVTGFCRKSKITQSIKEKFQRSCLEFIVCDLRPLHAIEGRGFTNLVQTAINVGAMIGSCSAEELIPSRRTVKRKMATETNVNTENLKAMLLSAIKQNCIIGITTDMWQDQKHRNYVSLTGHFFDDKLQSKVLSVFEFQDDAKTGENIKKNIISALKRFGVTSNMLMDNIYFVTDEGSNVKLALSCYHRQPCVCHNISTVLKHTLQLDKLSKSVNPMQVGDPEMEFVELIRKTVNATKALATYCKKSSLNNKLSSSIKQCNETRWNSLLVMLKSLQKVEAEVKDLLKACGQLRRIDDIDFVLNDLLINFLEPFQEATLALEGDLYPTIHHVFQWFIKLKRSATRHATDLPVIGFLKQRATYSLEKKFNVTPLHKIAFMLNPKFKSMRAFSENTKAEVINIARSLLHVHGPIARGSSTGIDTSSCPGITHTPGATAAEYSIVSDDHSYGNPQNQTSHCSIDDDFLDWQGEETFRVDGDELDLYLLHCFEDNFTNTFVTPDNHFDIMKFWLSTEVKNKFPLLSRIAIGVLSIPASSSSSERAFSCSGSTVSKKRTRLSSSTVDSIVTLNSNWK